VYITVTVYNGVIHRRSFDLLWVAWSHGGGITAAAVACLDRTVYRQT